MSVHLFSNWWDKMVGPTVFGSRRCKNVGVGMNFGSNIDNFKLSEPKIVGPNTFAQQKRKRASPTCYVCVFTYKCTLCSLVAYDRLKPAIFMFFTELQHKRDLNLNLPFSNWHFGLGLFDPLGSNVKGQTFFHGPCPP